MHKITLERFLMYELIFQLNLGPEEIKNAIVILVHDVTSKQS